MGDDGLLPRIIVFVILVLISAAFSGTNVAFSALNESNLAKKAADGNKRAGRILDIIRKPSSFLSTVDLIITTVSIVIGSFIARPFFDDLSAVLAGAGLHYGTAAVLSHIIVCLILIYFVTVFGILFPKRLAGRYYKRWIGILYAPVSFLIFVFRPVVALINLSVSALVRAAGINSKNIEENVTEEEIIMMVNEGHEQGVIEESEAEMISNIFEFDDKEVSDIMTHRRNIIGIDITLTPSQAAELMASDQFSRYPVYEDDEDNIVGILHLKDVMRLIINGDADTQIRDIMRKPMFVPDTQSINSLFREMQEKKIHMAIVVDEYGQSVGLVAMEDILEEIVGNIMDEYDQDEHFIQTVSGGWYMKGFTPVEDIREQLGIELDGDFETLNGYLISKLDRIPKATEGASVIVDGYTFRVIGVRDNAISLVRVSKNKEENKTAQ